MSSIDKTEARGERMDEMSVVCINGLMAVTLAYAVGVLIYMSLLSQLPFFFFFLTLPFHSLYLLSQILTILYHLHNQILLFIFLTYVYDNF